MVHSSKMTANYVSVMVVLSLGVPAACVAQVTLNPVRVNDTEITGIAAAKGANIDIRRLGVTVATVRSDADGNIAYAVPAANPLRPGEMIGVCLGGSSRESDCGSTSVQPAPELNGEQFHAIVGFQQSGASGTDSTQKFFLDFYGSRPVPGLFRVTTKDGESWFKWWGNVRIGSAPRSLSSAISVATLGSSASSLTYNQVAQAAEFLTGLDLRLGYIRSPLWNQSAESRARFLLSLVAAFGASGSLTANPPLATAAVFANPVNSPIDASFVKTYPAAANPAYKYVSFLPPLPDRYAQEYFGGFRLTTRYADQYGSAVRTPPAMVTATFGQSELITPGTFRGIVSRIEAFYPLSTGKPGVLSAIYLFATAQLRLGGAHATIYPLTEETSPNPAPDNTNTLYVVDRTSRDYYSIGVGLDLVQVVNGLKIGWE